MMRLLPQLFPPLVVAGHRYKGQVSGLLRYRNNCRYDLYIKLKDQFSQVDLEIKNIINNT